MLFSCNQFLDLERQFGDKIQNDFFCIVNTTANSAVNEEVYLCEYPYIYLFPLMYIFLEC